MVNLRRLADKAKDVVDKRGGTDALKEDAQELREIAKAKGGLKEKAKAAKDAISEPGTKGEETDTPKTKSPEAGISRQEGPPEGQGPTRSK